MKLCNRTMLSWKKQIFPTPKQTGMMLCTEAGPFIGLPQFLWGRWATRFGIRGMDLSCWFFALSTDLAKCRRLSWGVRRIVCSCTKSVQWPASMSRWTFITYTLIVDQTLGPLFFPILELLCHVSARNQILPLTSAWIHPFLNTFIQ